jgi:hypothetical protein
MRVRAGLAAVVVCASTFASGASVATREAPLRRGCAGDSDVRVTVPAGAPLTIRSMMSGQSAPCYKVAATIDGKTVEGYIDATAIGGLEGFERSRREAEHLDWNQVAGGLHLIGTGGAGTSGLGTDGSGTGASGGGAGPGIGPDRLSVRGPAGGLAAQAMSLLNASQPQKALDLLEPQLKKTRDPDLLAVAGAAAWRSDDTSRAAEYWRASLELRPNADLQKLYDRLQRETQNDNAGAKLMGMRVLLRYDADAIPIDSAREMLGTLDQEYARITAELGCPGKERVIAVAQSRDAYLKATQAAEWSGGEYDGRIHVPMTGKSGENLRRVLAHEMVHACLTMMGRWPAWLQEGVAQKLSGETLTPAARKQLTQALQSDRVPKLAALGQDWSRLDSDSAHAAYAESLAAIDLFYENYSGLGLRNLLRSPERLPEITVDLDRLLRQ